MTADVWASGSMGEEVIRRQAERAPEARERAACRVGFCKKHVIMAVKLFRNARMAVMGPELVAQIPRGA